MKSRMFRPAAPAAGDRRPSPGPRARHQRPGRLLAVAITAGGMAAALVLAACGSGGSSTASSSSSPSSGAKLTVADVAPFSGPDAALGPTYLASCYGATSSDEAASVAPIINSHKMAMFCMTGQSEFDHTHFPYFYRLVPPDLEESYAMTVIAQKLGYKRIALAFGNDIGSQTFIQPAVAALKKAGITLTTNQSLDLKATTFRTEAAAIVQSHPDAIMTEALGSADPTLFSEIKQLNGGKIIPIIGTSAAISPAFYKSSAAAVGANEFSSNFHADNLVVLSSGPAYQAFSKALLSQQGKVPGATGNFTTYLSAPGGVHLYDGMNLAALAMIMSKSTNPSVYGPDIVKIGDGVAGATVCYSFAQCAPLVKAGKAVKYVGPGGPTSFDSFHDSTGIFQIDTYTPSGQVKTVGTISPAELRALTG